MNFLDKFMDCDFGVEEKKEVMNKTISASSDPSEETVKVDNLDTDDSIEKDILAQRRAERDVTGVVPLPLFRFEEKQKEEIINVLKQISEVATDEIKNNIGAPYTPLFGYIDVLNKKEIQFKVDLVISRNKEIFNTSAKEFEIEVVNCFVDKKLRVRFNIEEDKIIDEKVDVEYSGAKKTIYTALTKLYQEIVNKINLKKTGTEKDMEIELVESAGDEDHGTGWSIILKYNKLIDYTNTRRGKEEYEMFLDVLDKDFANSLESNENAHIIEEQISINDFSRSSEAIADGMSENDSENSDSSEDQENNDASTNEESDDTVESGDDMGGDDESFDEGMDEGEDGESSDDSGDSGDSSSDTSTSTEKPKVAGKNPFTDLNSRNKISVELNELKDQIDKVLIKLGQFKSNVVVKKLIELSSFVEDALKNSYTVPLQDSLLRYSLYATQFEDLISELTRYFESNKSAQKS